MENNGTETMSMEDFEGLLANNPPEGSTAQTPPQTEATETTPETQAAAQTTPEPEPSEEPQPEPKPAGKPAKHTGNDVFAAMRVQNKTLQNALQAVLTQHGMDPKLAANPEQLIKEAEKAQLAAEAERQHVPEELLTRLTQLEKQNIESEQKRLSNLALAGFQQVKDKYNLSSNDIAEFAAQLQEAGTNPFEQELDLVRHYQLHNMDKIIALETKKAVEEALRNQNTAAQRSTKPTTAHGKDVTGAARIDTMAEFDRFIAGLNR